MPNPDSNNQDTFGYQVSDGQNADEGFVYITNVLPVNDAPTYASDAVTFQVSEDSEPGDEVGYLLTALDADGDTLTYSLTGSADFGIDPATGQITTVNYLDAIATPTHTVTVTATGSATPALTATIAVTIEVLAGEAATVTPPTPRAVDQGASRHRAEAVAAAAAVAAVAVAAVAAAARPAPRPARPTSSGP